MVLKWLLKVFIWFIKSMFPECSYNNESYSKQQGNNIHFFEIINNYGILWSFVLLNISLWMRYLENCFTNSVEIRNILSIHIMAWQKWFGVICSNQDGRHHDFLYPLFSCECNILRMTLPINFMFEICYHSNLTTKGINLGYLVKPRWPP